MHKNIKLNRCPQCHYLLPHSMFPSVAVVDICDKPNVVKTGKYGMLQIDKKANCNLLKKNASHLYVDILT